MGHCWPPTQPSTSPLSMAKLIISNTPLCLSFSSPAPGLPPFPSWQLPRGMDRGWQNPVFLPQPQLAPKEGEAQESSPTTPRSPAPAPPHAPLPVLLGYPQGAAGQGWAVCPLSSLKAAEGLRRRKEVEGQGEDTHSDGS